MFSVGVFAFIESVHKRVLYGIHTVLLNLHLMMNLSISMGVFAFKESIHKRFTADYLLNKVYDFHVVCNIKIYL